MLDCQLFGLKPWGHHLTNVLLHALNAALVFVLLQQLTGATWRSLLVAALFAVHPLRVESVAWVAERKDVLSGFFGLLCADVLRPLRAKLTSAECQSAGSETVATLRQTCHVHIAPVTLLLALPVLLRPRLDEQADAGDVAVRHVAAGLLAAMQKRLTIYDTIQRSQHVHRSRTGSGENSVLCPRGGGERRDLRGAEAAEALWRRLKTCPSARAAGTP